MRVDTQPPRPSITFIVAAYNLADHVASTLDSILQVAIALDEIIVVDDGSQDRTVDVVRGHEGLRQAPCPWQLIEQANSGVASSRLTGLASATREYVWFLDGDDVIDSNQAQDAIARLASIRPDILVFDFRLWWDEAEPRQIESPVRRHKPNAIETDPDISLAATLDDASCSLWARIILRTLAQKVMPDKTPKWSMYEDLAVMPHLVANADSLYYFPVQVIKYRQRASSLSQKRSAAHSNVLVRSAIWGSDAALESEASAASGRTFTLARAAGQRLIARKFVEAMRHCRESNASPLAIKRLILDPVNTALKPHFKSTWESLHESGQSGDRKVARHISSSVTSPYWYAWSQWLTGLTKKRR